MLPYFTQKPVSAPLCQDTLIRNCMKLSDQEQSKKYTIQGLKALHSTLRELGQLHLVHDVEVLTQHFEELGYEQARKKYVKRVKACSHSDQFCDKCIQKLLKSLRKSKVVVHVPKASTVLVLK